MSIDRQDFYVIRSRDGIHGLYQPNQVKRARRRADKMDLDYGACKYSVVKIRHLSPEQKNMALNSADWRRYDWAI